MMDVIDIAQELKNNKPNKTQIVLLGELLAKTRITKGEIESLLATYCRGEYETKERKYIARALYNKQIIIKEMCTREKTYKRAMKFFS